MNEKWYPIKEFEGLYEISNLSNIRSLPRNGTINNKKILKQTIDKNGYHTVTLHKNNKTKIFKVHRLMGINFIPNYENKSQINHIDGNKSNNLIENLEWCTPKENIRHSCRTGLTKINYQQIYDMHNKNKKPINQYNLYGNYIKTWESAREIENKLNIKNSNICNCCKEKNKTAGGYIWKYKN